MKLRLVGIALLGAVAAVGVVASSWSPQPAPLVTVSDPLVGERPPARPGAPNVVLVIGCTIRKDQLSIHGGPSGTSPFLEQLVAEGALFSDFVSTAPWTKAASTALLTGHHAVSVGMVEPGPGRNERRLPRDVTTLAEHLRGAGYHTVGATANPNLNGLFGFEQGFDAYVQLERLWRDDMLKVEAEDLLPPVDALVAERPDGRPLYLQVLLVDAHAPFDATPEEIARFSEPGVPEEVAAYRAALTRFDRGVEDLHALLAARGLDRDNTLFLVVSDHGEGLRWPEHHGKAHGKNLAPSTVGAVWVASGPGVGAGVRVEGVTSGVDVVPTVLGLLDLPGYEGEGVDHSARLPAGGRSARVHAFTDTWFIDVSRAAVYTDALACQRDFDRVELTRVRQFREGCFDRARDPLHARPLPNAALESVLVGWRFARMEQMAGVPVENAALSDDLEAQLEALGYLER